MYSSIGRESTMAMLIFFSSLPWITEVSNIRNEIHMVNLGHAPLTSIEVRKETFKNPVLEFMS